MAYGDFKSFPRRTTFDKVLPDKGFNSAKNPKYDGYQKGVASMFYQYFDKSSSGGGAKSEIKSK